MKLFMERKVARKKEIQYSDEWSLSIISNLFISILKFESDGIFIVLSSPTFPISVNSIHVSLLKT